MNHNYNILLVDDNPVNVELLGEILRYQGYNVETALSGVDAIQKSLDIIPDLIILDIAMPVLDGFEVMQAIKNNPQTAGIPVIFVTALNDTEDMERGIAMGAVDYITKPFQVEDTLARIKRHLK